ncbi:MAG TPA: RNA polymerase factor sigma-54 [Ktedonobacterales bacterium]|nr:RNA polymerase factor sigma-54 [Ktedonobacterales bacterium]
MDGIEMRAEASQTPLTIQGISYRQIAAVRLLQLPSQNLDEVVQREADDNPALEADTRQCCPRCNSPLESPTAPCPTCDSAAHAATRDERTRDDLVDLEGPIYTSGGSSGDEDLDDPMTRVAATAPTGEALLQALCFSISDEDAPIAEYLVGNLDHHGFLPLTIVSDTADALGCDEESVERVLAALQRLDPPGIGARGGQECLLIQLERLREAGDPHPLAEIMVRERFNELAHRRYREIARSLELTPRRVESEWEFIRSTLHPYPAHGFEGGASALAPAAAPVRPDVVMRKTATGYVAEVVERNRYVLRVNAEYLWARKHLARLSQDDATRTHIRKHVDQAQAFIAALRQRWDTMQRVSDALIEMQRDFLEHGQCALKPLTRADVARRIGLHESTVSRATDGKYVLLPNGQTASFDDFFDASLPAKKALLDVIGEENAERPYSDEQLMRILRRRGIEIARRTIAKYREELGVLPSRMRRMRSVAAQPVPAREPVPAGAR